VTERSLTLPLAPPAAWAALESTAEEWGAELAREDLGGRLRLPVLAGLRRGVISGRITVEPADGGSRVAFRPEEAGYTLQVQAVVVLAFAVAGAAVVVAWPFFPRLLSVAPFGALLALGGWFLVISRLRTSGPDEFLAAVQERAAQEEE
jgi:hypothetical protein